MRLIGPELELLVISPGGVGSTFLIEFLGRFVRTNSPSDCDALKHAPVPPLSLNPGLRIIYVFGDPLLATISLFRRGYHAVQSRKMQRGAWRDGPSIHWNASLEEYAAAGRDGFAYERHWRNYARKYLTNPTLFVRYECVWNHLPELLHFAGIARSRAGEFPRPRERAASVETISEQVLSRLETIHGDWRRKVDGFPDFEIRAPRSRVLPASRCAGAAILASLRRLAQKRNQPRPPLPEGDRESFAIAGIAGTDADALIRIGAQDGRRFVGLEGMSEPGPDVVIPADFARRTITLGDEILHARGILDVESLMKFLRIRFAICDEAGALPVLLVRGGRTFLNWFE